MRMSYNLCVSHGDCWSNFSIPSSSYVFVYDGFLLYSRNLIYAFVTPLTANDFFSVSTCIFYREPRHSIPYKEKVRVSNNTDPNEARTNYS